MTTEKEKLYNRLVLQARGLFDNESDPLANSANLTALLFMELVDINWAGFYYLRDAQLVLGPFQGKPACTRIPLQSGVCGTAAATRQTLIVDNVHEFDGHIACDGASNSEIVVPFIQNHELIGVLDVDSPSFSRFDQHDANGLQRLLEALGADAMGQS